MNRIKSSLVFDTWENQHYKSKDKAFHFIALIITVMILLITISNLTSTNAIIPSLISTILIVPILIWLFFLVNKKDLPKFLFPSSIKFLLRPESNMQNSGIIIIKKFSGNPEDEKFYARNNNIGEILSLNDNSDVK